MSAERVYAGQSSYGWVENPSYITSCLDLLCLKISILLNLMCNDIYLYVYDNYAYNFMLDVCGSSLFPLCVLFTYFHMHFRCYNFVITVMGKNLEASI